MPTGAVLAGGGGSFSILGVKRGLGQAIAPVKCVHVTSRTQKSRAPVLIGALWAGEGLKHSVGVWVLWCCQFM